MAHEVLVVGPVRNRLRHRTGQAGFTLVELGAVVTIVGILAVLAIVGYRKLITTSHNAEATHMVNAIRTAQEAYKAETGTYANISPALSYTGSGATSCSSPGSEYPAGPTAGVVVKTAWGAPCSGTQCNAGFTWDSIPVHVDGPVAYGYTTLSGFAGTAPGSISTMYRNGSAYTLSFPTPTTDWFLVSACGDMDADGNYSAFVSSSYSNEIYASNEGE